MPSRVAVTGATGIIGRFVIADLVARGVEVNALCQPTSDRSGFSTQVNWVVADMTSDFASHDVLPKLLVGADAVVHCAFSHPPGRYRGGEGNDPLAFWDNNFRPTLQLLQECEQQQIATCVLFSSRAVFAATGHTVTVSDDSPSNPDTHYGALKAAEEALAYRYAAQGTTRVHCLRSTGVFGQTLPMTRNKWWPLVTQCLQAHEKQIETRIDERVASEVAGVDLADAVWRLLCANDEPQVIFNCSDIVVSNQELAQRITNTSRPPEAATITRQSLAPVREKIHEGVHERVRGPLMTCEGLHRLGWRPNGELHLTHTLQSLVDTFYNNEPTS